MPHSLLRPIKCAKHNAKKWPWHHQCSLGCEQYLPPHRPTARQDGAKALPIFARGHQVIGTKIVESDSVSKNVCWTPLIFVQDFFVEKKQMLLWSYGHSGKYKFCSFTLKQHETFTRHETHYKENNWEAESNYQLISIPADSFLRRRQSCSPVTDF